MRLNAFLARAGVSSRRMADELIKAGRVKVNGQAATLNTRVVDEKVTLDGKLLTTQTLRYILLNKPSGYITTLKDEKGRRKVKDLIKIDERIVPVGRLDYDTTGALLFTNDGQLAYRLMHPKFKINKTYEAEVEGAITPDILNMLSSGIELEDGKTAPAKARQLAKNKIELVIHEGRNRQVRRMMEAQGLKLTTLHRSSYGPLDLNGLQPGKWRELTSAELESLKQ